MDPVGKGSMYFVTQAVPEILLIHSSYAVSGHNNSNTENLIQYITKYVFTTLTRSRSQQFKSSWGFHF